MCRLLGSGMACYGSEDCIECSGLGLLGCEVGWVYFVIYEGVKVFVGKDMVWSSFRKFPAACSLCM